MANKTIDKLTIDSVTYDLADAAARQDVKDLKAAVSGGMHFRGVTTTALTDGATTTTLAGIGGTKWAAGDFVVYNKSEFVWTGSAWALLGDLSGLGKLAFADKVTGETKLTIPTTTHTHTVDIAHTHTVTQGSVNAKGNFTPGGDVTLNDAADSKSKIKDVGSGQHIVTDADFDGTEFTAVGGTTDVYSITNVGSLPTYDTKQIPNVTSAGTMFKAEVSGTTLVLTAGKAPTISATKIVVNSMTNQGKLPTQSDAIKVATAATAKTTIKGLKAIGTETRQTMKELLSASFSGTEATVEVSGNAQGFAVGAVTGGATKTTGKPSATEEKTITIDSTVPSEETSK